MNSDLYSRVVRGILHAQASTEDGAASNTYELIERLKNTTNIDEDVHQKVLDENENCLEYWIKIKITSSFAEHKKFLLQVGRPGRGAVGVRERLLDANKEDMFYVSHARDAVLKIYIVDGESSSAPNSEDERERERVKPTNVCRTSMFLKRWVRAHGRARASLTLKLKNYAVNKEINHRLDSETTLQAVICRRMTSGKEFEPLKTDDIIAVVQDLYRNSFNKLADDQVGEALSNNILRRLAGFYGLSRNMVRLVMAGVVVDYARSLSRQSSTAVLNRFVVKFKVNFVKDADELSACQFLASNMLTYVDAILADFKDAVIFFPLVPLASSGRNTSTPNIQMEKTGPFASAAFDNLCHYLVPLITMTNMAFWKSANVPAIKQSIGSKLQQRIQSAIENYLVDMANVEIEDYLDYFCQKVDLFHAALRRSIRAHQTFCAELGFDYVQFALAAVEPTLVAVLVHHLDSAMTGLDARNNQHLVSFTKSTMRLFDAFRQLTEFLEPFVPEPRVSPIFEFEKRFERTTVFWTSTWKSVYISFIRKSVETGSGSQAIPASPVSEIPPSTAFRLQRSWSRISTPATHDFEFFPGTFNCIALCKALCDDFLRLSLKTPSTMQVCLFQVVNTMADGINQFAIQVRAQVFDDERLLKLIQAANGIEHASAYILENYKRFINVFRLLDLLSETERPAIGASIDHIMTSAVAKCHSAALKIVDSLMDQRCSSLRKHCEAIVTNVDNPNKSKKIVCFETKVVKQVFAHETTGTLYFYLERMIVGLKAQLLPSLFEYFQQQLWKRVRGTLTELVRDGQPPDYYETIDRECEAVARALGVVEWQKDSGLLKRRLRINNLETRELILSYYAQAGDITMSTHAKPGMPRIAIRIGYIPSTNQQILLLIKVMSAYDIPMLDSLTQSSDPYCRLELYPRAFFPLSAFPPDTTDTKLRTLNPHWNQSYQMAIPEEYFFTNGSCLCVSVLDYDAVSHNDLAGQAYLPLSQVTRLTTLGPKNLPKPITLPLILPHHAQYNDSFKILEQRAIWDPMAREVVDYEKYVRDNGILPRSAMDDKEYFLPNRMTLAQNGRQVKKFIHNISQKVGISLSGK